MRVQVEQILVEKYLLIFIKRKRRSTFYIYLQTYKLSTNICKLIIVVCKNSYWKIIDYSPIKFINEVEK